MKAHSGKQRQERYIEAIALLCLETLPDFRTLSARDKWKIQFPEGARTRYVATTPLPRGYGPEPKENQEDTKRGGAKEKGCMVPSHFGINHSLFSLEKLIVARASVGPRERPGLFFFSFALGYGFYGGKRQRKPCCCCCCC